MFVLLMGTNSYAQFITVLIIFVFVMGATLWTTKWIANYQKKQGLNDNIEVIETARISGNKYVQIIRIGKTYKIIAIGKDTVTFLGDIDESELKFSDKTSASVSFKDILGSFAKEKNDNTESKDVSEDDLPKE